MHRTLFRLVHRWHNFAVASKLEKDESATKLQLMYRGRRARADLVRRQRTRDSATRIQARFRVYRERFTLQTRKYELTKEMVKAALKIQTIWRGKNIYGLIRKVWRKAATDIQRVVRGHLARILVARLIAERRLRAAILVEKMARGLMARSKVYQMRLARGATGLQRIFRGYNVREHWQLYHYMVARIRRNRPMRDNPCTLLVSEKELIAALRISSVWRGHVARVAVEEMKRRLRIFWATIVVKDFREPSKKLPPRIREISGLGAFGGVRETAGWLGCVLFCSDACLVLSCLVLSRLVFSSL